MSNNWVIKNDPNCGMPNLVWIWHQHGEFLVSCISDDNANDNGFLTYLICSLCKVPCPETIKFQYNLFSTEDRGCFSIDEYSIYIETLDLRRTITILNGEEDNYSLKKDELLRVREIIKSDYREYDPKNA
jgi:hypothetical protein